MPDTPVADREGGPYDAGLERRVLRLEEDGREVTAAIIRVEESIGRLEARGDRLDAKFDRLDASVQRLEVGFVRLESMLAATLPHLATKGELTATRSDLQGLLIELKSDISIGLAEKPGKVYMWGVLAVLLVAYACGLAGLAVLK
jgi:hypothetical protein